MADDPWRIAVHEAGHWIAARLLGLTGCGGASVEVHWERATALMDDLGCDDGGALLWAYTAELMAPYEAVIVGLADELMKARSLAGFEIDAPRVASGSSAENSSALQPFGQISVD